MNLREKYGEWGLILGATEGVGKAFCEKIAAGGMNVVMVGRREEKLNVLAGEIRETYGVETKVVRADFSQPGAAETVFAATEGLDMGFMSYVACLHSFGKIQDTPWEKHEAMINVNVVTFLKCFHHYMRIFAAQDRGAVINVSSMTGISSSPWNGQYGAGKAFILKMTEAVACECEGTGVDVEVITLGTTLTPSLLSNLPGGPQGEAVMKIALTPRSASTRPLRSWVRSSPSSPASATRTPSTTGRPTTPRTSTSVTWARSTGTSNCGTHARGCIRVRR